MEELALSIQKPASTKRFIHKLLRNMSIGFAIILISIWIGMLGYHYFEGLNVVDAYVNAAMILSGMGEIAELKTDGGKIFAGTYALFSGIIFLVVIALVFAPIIHLFLHKFHMQDSNDGAGK
jgi:hypothetical protein